VHAFFFFLPENSQSSDNLDFFSLESIAESWQKVAKVYIYIYIYNKT